MDKVVRRETTVHVDLFFESEYDFPRGLSPFSLDSGSFTFFGNGVLSENASLKFCKLGDGHGCLPYV